MTREVEGEEVVVDGEILLGEDDEDDALELVERKRREGGRRGGQFFGTVWNE